MIIFLFSLFLGFVMGFALGSGGAFILVSVGSFWLLTFVNTVANRTNLGFRGAVNGFLALARYPVLWFVHFLPLQVFVWCALFGGIGLAPLWYMIYHGKAFFRAVGRFFRFIWKLFIMAIPFVLAPVILLCLAAGVILIIKPVFVYSYLHWGVLIAISAGVLLLSVFFCSLAIRKYHVTRVYNRIARVLGIIVLPLVILGVMLSLGKTFEISTAREMNAFGNAPCTKNTLFIITEDIDFGGKEVRWYSAYEDFKGAIDGREHTLSNFEAEVLVKKTKDDTSVGLVRKNHGLIKNLNFRDSKIYVTSDGYFYLNAVGVIVGENYGKVASCSVEGVELYIERGITVVDDNYSLTVGWDNELRVGVIDVLGKIPEYPEPDEYDGYYHRNGIRYDAVFEE